MSAKKPIVKKVTKATISRQQEIRREIYKILQEEAHDTLVAVRQREDNFTKRLISIENTGVPQGTLEEIKSMVSQTKYVVNKQTAAIEALLKMFKVSAELFADK